jgi:hypothetical protein
MPGSQTIRTRLKGMKLAVNKIFMASSFDLEGRLSSDGPAERGSQLFLGSVDPKLTRKQETNNEIHTIRYEN